MVDRGSGLSDLVRGGQIHAIRPADDAAHDELYLRPAPGIAGHFKQTHPSLLMDPGCRHFHRSAHHQSHQNRPAVPLK